jgi:type III restriction enzyme
MREQVAGGPRGAHVADVIENPILNSPYRVPTRHFRFDDDGITSAISKGRRPRSFFIPIAQPTKKGPTAKLTLAGEGWTAERLTPNDFINRVRERVGAWRASEDPTIKAVSWDVLDCRAEGAE